MPDVTDGHAYPRLAASGFRTRSVIHAGAQHTEFELADAAFHSQQQPIVRAARIVYGIKVDHACADKSAQFQVAPLFRLPSVRGSHRDFNVAEGAATRFIDQVILSPLAFEIGLDLRLGRLPDVHHGFPQLQNRRSKEVSARHRCPPLSRRPPPASGDPLSLRTFIVRNRGDSNAITSWRGVAGRDGVVTTGLRKCFIPLLLGDSDIVGRASPKTAIDEELTQVLKGHDIDLRRTERHVGARCTAGGFICITVRCEPALG